MWHIWLVCTLRTRKDWPYQLLYEQDHSISSGRTQFAEKSYKEISISLTFSCIYLKYIGNISTVLWTVTFLMVIIKIPPWSHQKKPCCLNNVLRSLRYLVVLDKNLPRAYIVNQSIPLAFNFMSSHFFLYTVGSLAH